MTSYGRGLEIVPNKALSLSLSLSLDSTALAPLPAQDTFFGLWSLEGVLSPLSR